MSSPGAKHDAHFSSDFYFTFVPLTVPPQVAGEVCSYFDATASGIVAQLVVSDGERSRHNRKALLAKHFKVCGVAISAHPTVGVACVITLAGGYGPRPLSSAADVVCMAGEKPSAEFRQVVESVPVPQITAEVSFEGKEREF